MNAHPVHKVIRIVNYDGENVGSDLSFFYNSDRDELDGTTWKPPFPDALLRSQNPLLQEVNEGTNSNQALENIILSYFCLMGVMQWNSHPKRVTQDYELH